MELGAPTTSQQSWVWSTTLRLVEGPVEVTQPRAWLNKLSYEWCGIHKQKTSRWWTMLSKLNCQCKYNKWKEGFLRQSVEILQYVLMFNTTETIKWNANKNKW